MHLAGTPIHVLPPHLADIATRTVYRIERVAIKKRRKGYRIVAHREPCALMFNPQMLQWGRRNGKASIMLHPEQYAVLLKL